MQKQLQKKCKPFARILGLGIALQLIVVNLLLAQGVTVTGKVTASDEPGGLPGVNIIEKGTSNGGVSDADGTYRINVASGATLVFSSIGYASQEVVVGNQTTIDIVLTLDVTQLQEIVVIGYGTVAKRDLTGSVASVDGKTIASAPVPNIAQAMQGKLAGVNITTQDGRPGADIGILIRGGTSISQSNEPLILIDGFPGSLNDVPTTQVASIDVLKDASATAIYGARGANGVILITTKSAKTGETKVTYNGYVKFNKPTKYLEALQPYDYLEYVWANAAANGAAYRTPFEQLYGIGAFTTENPGGIESYRNMASDDIQRAVYNESVSWNHDITLTSGTDKTKILFSAGYTDDQGMKLNSYYKRINALFKLTQKIFDNVTFDLNTRYTNTENFGNESTSNGSGSLLSTAYKFRPIATSHILGDVDALLGGNLEQYGKNVLWDSYSPATRIADYDPLDLNQSLRTIASLKWGITKGLTYDTYVTLNNSWGQRKYWSGAIYNGTYTDPSGIKLFAGNADYRKSDSWGLRWTNTLSYDFKLGDVNKLNLLVGHELYNSGGTSMRIQSNQFPANFDKETAFAQINNGTTSTSSDVAFPDRLLSFFGRANYTLQDRYLFTFTFRADGSSKFITGNQWGYFPAGAFAWRVIEEPFMKGINWLDDLKLRFSYGEVGNNRIQPNLWAQSWASETDLRWQYSIGNELQPAYDLSSGELANTNLKWETTITRDIGADFALLNGRLSGTIDAYWNTTKDLLMYTSIPGITGFTAILANIGQTSNKGVELSLTGKVLDTEDWNIAVGGNINFNRNNVDKLADNVTGLYGADWGGITSYPAQDYILKEGQPVGLVRGLTYEGYYTPEDFDYNAGVYTLKAGVADLGPWMAVVHGLTGADRPSTQRAYPGLPKYKDVNDDGIIDDQDISVIGEMAPIHTGGFNISASYRNIDLGLYFNWSYGNDVYNANKLASLYGPKEQGVYENKLAIQKDAYKIYDIVNGQLTRVTTPAELNALNANATLPFSYNEVGGVSTLGIEDGSFLRLNTLTLGYSFSESLASKARIKNLRVYGSIYNVFTITGYSGLDPEVNVNTSHNNARYPTLGLDYGTYPRARSFVLGLNLSF